MAELGSRPEDVVRGRELSTALAGRHVRSGVRVLPGGAVPDVVFTAPNSVSFRWSQLEAGQQAEIEDAVLESATLLLDHLVRHHPPIGTDPGISPSASRFACGRIHQQGAGRPLASACAGVTRSSSAWACASMSSTVIRVAPRSGLRWWSARPAGSRTRGWPPAVREASTGGVRLRGRRQALTTGAGRHQQQVNGPVPARQQ
ncbi:MAG TPA: hypothetical protein VFX16_21190 [Pseudonocardiaceae bacterium]|nr:hypothetical protein [Pseudonocardiaceae bacterium]